MSSINRNIFFLTLFGALLLVLFLLDLVFGSLSIPLEDVISVLTQSDADSIYSEIIKNIRLPKAFTAIFVGSALSVGGLMMQTLFRNALADPYILGVSSGASLGVAIVVMLSTAVPTLFLGNWGMILAAVTGATVVLLLVVAISYKVENSMSLLIVGIMLGTIATSIVGIIQYFSNPDAIKIFVVWSMGSLNAVTWEALKIVVPLVVLGVFIAFVLQKRMNALLLGEKYASGLGINIRQTRIFIVLSTGVLAGAVTAFTGPISFVGIAVPHIVRGLLKTANHELLIPASILLGADMLLLCDIISQVPQYPLPINTISALLGAPIIIWILLKKR